MTDMRKDHERFKQDMFQAKSIGCPVQNKIKRRGPDNEFVLYKECNLNDKPCLIENCLMEHWGLV